MACHKDLKIIPYDEYKRIDTLCRSINQLSFDEVFHEIIYNDLKTLKKYKIEKNQISDIMQKIIDHHNKYLINNHSLKFSKKNIKFITKYFNEKNEKKHEYNVISTKKSKINNKFFVFEIYWDKNIICPFGKDKNKYKSGSKDFIIFDIDYKNKIIFNEIQIHQIAEHGFFQGIKSFYRLNPLALIDFFNIESKKNYKTQYKKIEICDRIFYSDLIINDIDNIYLLNENINKIKQLNNSITNYCFELCFELIFSQISDITLIINKPYQHILKIYLINDILYRDEKMLVIIKKNIKINISYIILNDKKYDFDIICHENEKYIKGGIYYFSTSGKQYCYDFTDEENNFFL